MKKLDHIKSKIFSIDDIKTKLALWRFKDRRIVFTNGCFDILHLGHIDYLSKAADLGNILIIGLNSDVSVKKIKGNNRPIMDEKSRAAILASISFVDAVVIFDEETPYNLINLVKPDVLVKGDDYKPEDIVGYDILKTYGGKVITLDFLPGYSTTAIEKKIKNN
ncbi:MAG: D-glycero-beta-D-manno-heptose 1-phosphate adenylyltransferase [Bacteroidales bacterium]|nr:D-glycero-beta-D-manno-heptose 1-phosphate adenylyltransferase [Bacteroidales bacterium]